jgi:hypothetical protein
MTLPRSLLVSADAPGYYHVFSRCVRRAWLCGVDPLTGRSFEHRRQWIEDRLLFLCSLFSVELYSYAVLSNHYHAVLRLDPTAPRHWSDETVAARWLELCPPKPGPGVEQRRRALLETLLVDPARVAIYRKRLGSLSWLMKHLNEHIARRANQEDGCRGRFWEGRFESQALLDERAVLAAMVYVDLNPLRAGMDTDPLNPQHTSIRRRLDSTVTLPVRRGYLPPLAAGSGRLDWGIDVSLAAYCDLLMWTAQRSYPSAVGTDQRSSSSDDAHATRDWLTRFQALHIAHRRAIGGYSALLAYAQRAGRQWIRGMGSARRSELTESQEAPRATRAATRSR